MIVSRLATGLAALALSGLGVMAVPASAGAVPGASAPHSAAKPKPKPTKSPDNCPNPKGHYPPGQCKPKPKGEVGDDTVEHGQREHVHGDDWQPDSDVQVYAESTPIYLATLRASSAGVIDGFVIVPGTLALGPHHILFRGKAATGEATDVRVPVQVVSRPGAGGSGSGSGTGGLGHLPHTGAEIAVVAVLGGALVTAGGIAVAGGRRRRLAA